jgi:hypothetical protein
MIFILTCAFGINTHTKILTPEEQSRLLAVENLDSVEFRLAKQKVCKHQFGKTPELAWITYEKKE